MGDSDRKKKTLGRINNTEESYIPQVAYGPVFSRRLGWSLGINNIPPKNCTYSCVYCQLGKAAQCKPERANFYDIEDIIRAVKGKVDQVEESGRRIDYLSFVSTGEPTLDAELGRQIELLKPLGIRIAVLTNASLIWNPDVRHDLLKADWVSFKVDTINQGIWLKVNRPHRSLNWDEICEGMLEFARSFKGVLTTETMMLQGISEDEEGLCKLTDFLCRLRPDKAYLAVPTRPPAEKSITGVSRGVLDMAYRILSSRLDRVELLTGHEGDDFTITGDLEQQLLAITSVHPMKEESVVKLLDKASAGWEVVTKLIANGSLVELVYGDSKYYRGRTGGN